MQCTILLHSATGNTRLAARFAARRLEESGHRCTVQDVVAEPALPDLGAVDLLGVACPTNFFNQSQVMKAVLERLPPLEDGPRPAFLLATCSGEPGAHFVTQAEQLTRAGWLVLGARALSFPDAWPPHRAVTRRLSFAAPLVQRLADKVSLLRMPLSLTHPDVQRPGVRTVARLGRFVDRVARRAAVRDLLMARTPEDLASERPSVLVRVGRSMDLRKIRKTTAIRVDARRCSRCATCVSLCPSGNLTQEAPDRVPRVGQQCVGCWACYQHCPEDAISGWNAPAGVGRYPGPSREVVEIFQARWLD